METGKAENQEALWVEDTMEAYSRRSMSVSNKAKNVSFK